MLKLLSGLSSVDSEAKKACSKQAETNQRHLYAHCTACYMYMYSASRAYHSALAQVVLPAELEKVLLIYVTVCYSVAFIVLFSTLAESSKKGTGDK